MRKTLLGALCALAGMAGAAMADDLIGDWRTAADDNGNTGLIRVTQCGASLCGTLVQAYDPSGSVMDSENVGRQIIWDTNPTGEPGMYAGRLYSPDRDATYRSRLQLSGGTLVVSGCVLGGTICREGGRWQRAN